MNKMPLQEAIKVQLENDSLISYKIIRTEQVENSGTIWFIATVKDIDDTTIEKDGVLNFCKTVDGTWVFDWQCPAAD